MLLLSLDAQKSGEVKFIYSEKATKFCEIPTLLLSYVVPVNSKVEIFQNFVAFSAYMNFMQTLFCQLDFHDSLETHFHISRTARANLAFKNCEFLEICLQI